MTIYSKEIKITISRVEYAIKGNREDCTLLGGELQRENRRKRSKKLGKGGRECKKKIQRKGEKYRWNGLRTWMGSIEWKRTRG
jgi:hypothetical protein